MFTHGSRSRKVTAALGATFCFVAAAVLLFFGAPLPVDWMLKTIFVIAAIGYVIGGYMVARWGFRRAPAVGGVRVR